MKAVLITDPGNVELGDIAAPIPRRGELGIRTTCSLISAGTELHYVALGFTNPSSSLDDDPRDRCLGYCATGIVESVGHGVVGFRAGDRVVAMGWRQAIHAERIAVPQRLCAVLPAGVADENAVFAALAATALHAVNRGAMPAGAEVLVVGGGLVGQLVARVAEIRGARVLLVEREFHRRQIAAADGLRTSHELTHSSDGTTEPPVIDVAFLCTHGECSATMLHAMSLVRAAPDGNRRGRIVCVGRLQASIPFAAELGNIDIAVASRCGTGYRDDAFQRGLRDCDAPPGEARVDQNLKLALGWIATGLLNVTSLRTHTFPLESARAAYDLLRDPSGVLGITFSYGSSAPAANRRPSSSMRRRFAPRSQ